MIAGRADTLNNAGLLPDGPRTQEAARPQAGCQHARASGGMVTRKKAAYYRQ